MQVVQAFRNLRLLSSKLVSNIVSVHLLLDCFDVLGVSPLLVTFMLYCVIVRKKHFAPGHHCSLPFKKFENHICVFQKILQKNLGVGNDISYKRVKDQSQISCILSYTKITKMWHIFSDNWYSLWNDDPIFWNIFKKNLYIVASHKCLNVISFSWYKMRAIR